MTRKDYVKLAGAFVEASRASPVDQRGNEAYLLGLDRAIEEVANVLRADNPRFDRGKFYKAAGRITA